MEHKSYSCKIMRAIDGDTFEIMVDLGWDIYHSTHIRIRGINCEELHDKDPSKRDMALKAKKMAESLVTMAGVVTAWGRDKYGRMVCDLATTAGDYGSKMISGGMAKISKYQLAQEYEIPAAGEGEGFRNG